MDSATKERFVREKAFDHAAGREAILWSVHAVNKLRVERMRVHQVEASLAKGILIEDYPMEGRVFPGCLVYGTIDKDPIHVVVAIDAHLDRVFVVTVYRPSPKRWENDFKTRKR